MWHLLLKNVYAWKKPNRPTIMKTEQNKRKQKSINRKEIQHREKNNSNKMYEDNKTIER